MNAEDCATNRAAKTIETCGLVTGGINIKRSSIYWWMPDLNDLRKLANHARRVFQRKIRRVGANECATDLDDLRRTRLELTKAMRNAKELCWKKLCDQVEKEPWGKPFKLVMGKLTRSQPASELQEHGVLHTIVNGIFPIHLAPAPRAHITEEAPRVTVEELTRAASSLRNKISSGIDGITNKVLKIIVWHQPGILLQTFNKCLDESRFSRDWKKSRLVLIKKGDKPLREPSSYRPLCFLNCMGKLFEKIIDNRLRDILEADTPGGLSENQYRFRGGRSTIDALQQVCKLVDDTGPNKKIGLLTLDIKNAINSAPWKKVLDAMEDKGIPPTYADC